MARVEALSCVQAEVAPCFLPSSFAGPYWIVAFSVQEGWALVSGGPPTLPGANGTCRTGTGVNGSGLWIFTRQQRRDGAIVDKVRAIAAQKGNRSPPDNNIGVWLCSLPMSLPRAGFDLSVLVDIDQSNCKQLL
jgi:hypothetical protein